MLKTRRLERVVKGFANHRRIQIMELVEKEPELSLAEVSTKLKINIKTASEHIRRLTIPGLVYKRTRGNNVLHKLSPLGISILKFLRKLE
ncbi:MAG: winged helix-turn-helix transcriptional regulator [Patescibacteria group bacterium]|mgnify:CR=1 FL=1